MRFTVLASGSTGNAMVVEGGGMKILIDAGLSAKKLEQLMEERGVSGKEMDAVFVTHEHSDHIKGLGAFVRKHHTPVYANEKTWQALNKHLGELCEDKRRLLQTGDMVDLGAMKIESFPVSHDAEEPVGYCFYEGEEKLSLATDLGYASSRVKEKLADSDAIVFEANHDVSMLRAGKYPWNIKRRILGDTGHLSNEAAGEALTEIVSGNTSKVYLAHLSRDHNMMDLARLTVNSILEDEGVQVSPDHVQLKDTYYDRPTKWDSVRRV